ncbi:MAG: hypothetical protein ACUVTD_08990 [Nitrososphaerales archaeon]
MADKWEEARYVLNVSRTLPDTEYRPMYKGIAKGRLRPVFFYPKYVDFPTKYAIIVHEGDELPNLYVVAFLSNTRQTAFL